ncbi:MAG: DALR anticodon-binding domain-containing protein [Thainema sp.]
MALKLAAKTNLTVIQVATFITHQMTDLRDNCDTLSSLTPLSPPFWLHFTIRQNESGWIYLNLTDLGIAIWLEHLTTIRATRRDYHDGHQAADGSPVTSHSVPSLTTVPQKLRPEAWSQRWPQDWPTIWAAQYVHNRTFSLLQLADREGLLPLRTNKTSSNLEIGATCFGFGAEGACLPPSHRYPWFTEQEQLRIQHSSEWELIRCFITLTDEWQERQGSYTPQQVHRQLHLLVQSFEQFHRQCQIFGDVAERTPELAQARLGLVQITQRLMRILLEEGLGVEALMEL